MTHKKNISAKTKKSKGKSKKQSANNKLILIENRILRKFKKASAKTFEMGKDEKATLKRLKFFDEQSQSAQYKLGGSVY